MKKLWVVLGCVVAAVGLWLVLRDSQRELLLEIKGLQAILTKEIEISGVTEAQEIRDLNRQLVTLTNDLGFARLETSRLASQLKLEQERAKQLAETRFQNHGLQYRVEQAETAIYILPAPNLYTAFPEGVDLLVWSPGLSPDGFRGVGCSSFGTTSRQVGFMFVHMRELSETCLMATFSWVLSEK